MLTVIDSRSRHDIIFDPNPGEPAPQTAGRIVCGGTDRSIDRTFARSVNIPAPLSSLCRSLVLGDRLSAVCCALADRHCQRNVFLYLNASRCCAWKAIVGGQGFCNGRRTFRRRRPAGSKKATPQPRPRPIAKAAPKPAAPSVSETARSLMAPGKWATSTSQRVRPKKKKQQRRNVTVVRLAPKESGCPFGTAKQIRRLWP